MIAHDGMFDAAVRAARAALPGWAATPPARRAERLTALAAQLGSQRAEMAATITAELGAPIGFAQRVHAGLPVAVTGSYAELAATHAFEERIGTSTVLHEPVGVGRELGVHGLREFLQTKSLQL